MYKLKIRLLSETTFGRGDGVAGLIDQEVEHDDYGFPYLRGRTLKGLLNEEADNIISVLPRNVRQDWLNIADTLFGIPGSSLQTMGVLRIGDACLPEDLREAVAEQIKNEELNEELTEKEILDSLTTIRHQTAIDSQLGVASQGSLRSFRVVIRELEFKANLLLETALNPGSLSLLSASVLAVRRIGSGRNRGRGYVKCTLHDNSEREKDITYDYLNLLGKQS